MSNYSWFRLRTPASFVYGTRANLLRQNFHRRTRLYVARRDQPLESVGCQIRQLWLTSFYYFTLPKKSFRQLFTLQTRENESCDPWCKAPVAFASHYLVTVSKKIISTVFPETRIIFWKGSVGKSKRIWQTFKKKKNTQNKKTIRFINERISSFPNYFVRYEEERKNICPLFKLCLA